MFFIYFLSRPVAGGRGHRGIYRPFFPEGDTCHRPGHIIRDRNKKIKKNEMKNEIKKEKGEKIGKKSFFTICRP